MNDIKNMKVDKLLEILDSKTEYCVFGDCDTCLFNLNIENYWGGNDENTDINICMLRKIKNNIDG
jgi:hypothetical protein